MTCLFCQSPMKIESSSRGITTYGCSRGCSDYQYEEIIAPVAAQTTCAGTILSGPTGNGASAPIVATT